jgi:hypothetical protein
MDRPAFLTRRIRILTMFFILGLVISGVTAIPLNTEISLLAKWFPSNSGSPAIAEMARWLGKVQAALGETKQNFPFLFYGTDWLAFGHFVIALAFVGALRDPVRNRWLFSFGMIACALVVPYALMFGALRGIPFWWRLIDCSFGVFGFVPLWLCHKWADELERPHRARGTLES